jgi:hypothetical protein
MMFIDDDHDEPFVAALCTPEVDVHHLLAACAAEALRQAKAVARLDDALGATLTNAAFPSDLASSDPATSPGPRAAPQAISALQHADLVRQEMNGLARALDLVVEFTSLGVKIPVQRVRDCTPLRGLQQRLISPPDPHG